MTVQRIVSFLPSATEILYELGVGEKVVAVTHECNFPEAQDKPRVIRPAFDPSSLDSSEINQKVSEVMQSTGEMYLVNQEVLKNASPDMIVAQGICEVCAPHQKEIDKAIAALGSSPEVLVLDPHNLDDILENILEIGKRVGKNYDARQLVDALAQRIQNIKSTSKNGKMILCLEWLDPLFSAGHWVPQMVEYVGGTNGISKTGEDSRRISFQEVLDFDPDIIILMPCGFDLKRTIDEYNTTLRNNPTWNTLRAVNKNMVYAVDANSYFSKPGIKTVAGLEILAKIVEPQKYAEITVPDGSFSNAV